MATRWWLNKFDKIIMGWQDHPADLLLVMGRQDPTETCRNPVWVNYWGSLQTKIL